MLSDQDHLFLSTTLTLSRKGNDAVYPNPRVGAVIVKDGTIVAEGYHPFYGGPHAEALALEAAGPEASGATLYCNLEPCSYTAPEKHNAPCTQKIIAAGVSRVVVGQLDPNRHVRGRGVEQMRNAGIEVEVAPDGPEASRMWYHNARFNTVHSLKRPFVQLKLAQSLDGKIATAGGDSQWISDEAARTEVHRLRAQSDAVLVGIGSALSDDPRLTVRTSPSGPEAPRRQPQAVVLDPRARLPLDSFLIRNRAEQLIVYTLSPHALLSFSPQERQECAARSAALQEAGVQVRPVPTAEDGRLSLPLIMEDLFAHGIQSVLVEGGARVATSLLKQQLFDTLHLYIAPLFIGGDGQGIGPLDVARVSEALQLEQVSPRVIGNQTAVFGFRKGWLEELHRTLREEHYVYGAC